MDLVHEHVTWVWTWMNMTCNEMDLSMNRFGHVWNDLDKIKSKTHKWHIKESDKLLRIIKYNTLDYEQNHGPSNDIMTMIKWMKWEHMRLWGQELGDSTKGLNINE